MKAMTRRQRLFFSSTLATMMILHMISEILDQRSGDSSWLRTVGMLLSAVVTLGAIGVFVRTLGQAPGAQAVRGGDFESRESFESRQRLRWLALGAVVSIFALTLFLIVLARMAGFQGASASHLIDMVNAVASPLLGALTLGWLLRGVTSDHRVRESL